MSSEPLWSCNLYVQEFRPSVFIQKIHNNEEIKDFYDPEISLEIYERVNKVWKAQISAIFFFFYVNMSNLYEKIFEQTIVLQEQIKLSFYKILKLLFSKF